MRTLQLGVGVVPWENSGQVYMRWRDDLQVMENGGYMAEEQQILQEVFQTFFRSHHSIDLVGSSDDTSGEALAAASA